MTELLSEDAVFRIAYEISTPELREEYLRQVSVGNSALYQPVQALLAAGRQQPGPLEPPSYDVGVTVDDSYATTVDQTLSVAVPGVLDNDSDPDGDPITAVPGSDTTAEGGQITVNADGSFTFTPAAGFTGTDTFSYTITDGDLNSLPATVSVEVTSGSTDTPLYVYDIRFESRAGGKFWQAVFEIRSDSNDNGFGDDGDTGVAGVAITVEFAGQTYTGTTDADGIFRTGWIKGLSSGDHYANVVDLTMANYFWDMLMDLEHDSDQDGKPDDVLSL